MSTHSSQEPLKRKVIDVDADEDSFVDIKPKKKIPKTKAYRIATAILAYGFLCEDPKKACTIMEHLNHCLGKDLWNLVEISCVDKRQEEEEDDDGISERILPDEGTKEYKAFVYVEGSKSTVGARSENLIQELSTTQLVTPDVPDEIDWGEETFKIGWRLVLT